MNRISLALGIAAACIHATAYLLYSVQASHGTSKPLVSVIGVSAALAILLTFTYQAATSNWIITLQYYAMMVAATATFVYILKIGRFEKLTKDEIASLTAGVVSGVVWLVFHNAAFANLILIATVLIVYRTLYVRVWKDPTTETALPWKLWTLAYAISTMNVVYGHARPIAYVSPIVFLFAHLTVAVFCSKRRKERFRRHALSTPSR